jgi:tyrosine-protein kinase
MGGKQLSQGTDISALFGVLRRRGLIVLLAVAVGGVVGYALSKGKDPEYTSKANLLLRGPTPAQQQGGLEPGVPDSPQDRQNIVLSDPVKSRAETRLKGQVGAARAKKLLRGVDAFSGQKSSTVRISAVAKSPKTAALVANSVAASAIDYRRESTVSRSRRAMREALRELDRLNQGGGPPSTAAQALQQSVAGLRQEAVTADGNADLTSRATPARSPTSPKPSRDAVIGGFAGLLIGLVLAMTREQLDRRLKHSSELERVFGLPVLANVPRSRALASSNGRALDELPGSEAEAFQMLRANLRFLNTDRELRSVVVTSAGVGDGKSTVALNLAKADASVGKRVLLIEADMRRPGLEKLLGMGSDVGLSAYLADPSVELKDVTRRVPVAHGANGAGGPLTMDVVQAGAIPANPSGLVNSKRMVDLVREAERDYDLVVIDTSPAGLVADAIPLMSQATAVVIVGRVGQITGPEADSLREQLERIDAPAFGLVANFARGQAGYGYGYGYD